MSKIKNWFKMGNCDVPTCVKEQIMRFFLLAAAFLALGILLAVLSFNVMTAIVMLIMAGVIAGMGYYRLLSVSRKGYDRVEGICERVEYTDGVADRVGHTLIAGVDGSVMKDIPKRYLIRTADKTIAVPFHRQNPLMRERDRVVVYLKKNSEFYEWNGVHTPDVIYGYEILYGEREDEEESDN